MLPVEVRNKLRSAAMVGTLRRGGRRRLPRQRLPLEIERAYADKLQSYVQLARDLLAPALEELPRLVEVAAQERIDHGPCAAATPARGCHWCGGSGIVDDAAARRLDLRPGPCGCAYRLDAGEAQRVGLLVQLVTEKLGRAIEQRQLETLAVQTANATSRFQKQQLGRQVRAALGVDVLGSDAKLARLVQGFAVENVALIKDIPARIIRDVELASTRAVASGTRWEVLAKDLEQRFGYGADRAKLIARDQVGKLYGQINVQRQRDIGVRRFIWRTVNDQRVRDDHEMLADEIFSYDDPPAEGMPGEPIQCRCHAEPMLEDILSELEAELDAEEAGAE